MKRDLDLVRAIMMAVEDSPPGDHLNKLSLGDKTDPVEVLEHVRLLIQGAYLSGSIYDCLSKEDSSYVITGMTWKGHDFVGAARSNTIWNKAKDKLTSLGVTATVDIVVEVLKSILKKELDLT